MSMSPLIKTNRLDQLDILTRLTMQMFGFHGNVSSERIEARPPAAVGFWSAVSMFEISLFPALFASSSAVAPKSVFDRNVCN